MSAATTFTTKVKLPHYRSSYSPPSCIARTVRTTEMAASFYSTGGKSASSQTTEWHIKKHNKLALIAHLGHYLARANEHGDIRSESLHRLRQLKANRPAANNHLRMRGAKFKAKGRRFCATALDGHPRPPKCQDTHRPAPLVSSSRVQQQRLH